jgi:hypothetical protein
MKFSLIAILGLFAAGSQAARFSTLDFSYTIPGCPVNVQQVLSSGCLKQVTLLNSTVTSGSQLSPTQINSLCTSCSNDLTAVYNALQSSGTPACTQVAPMVNLECQKSADGGFCLTKITDQSIIMNTVQSLATSAMSNTAFTAEQCKMVDCCLYQEFSFLNKQFGSSPNNIYSKIVPALDNCAVPVPKTCAQSTIILS